MVSRTTSAPIQHSRVIDHSPVFYGWVIWAIAMLGIMATAPGQAFTASLFIDEYIHEFFTVPQASDSVILSLFGENFLLIGTGMGRTIVSGLFGLGTFISALCLTWVGRRIDSAGNRTVGTIIAVTFSLVLIAQAFISGPFTMFLSFIAIRFLGQGSLYLVSTTAIAKWWRIRRGWMMGLALVGFALFQRAYLPLLADSISTHGWRMTWVLLGVIVGLLIPPLWWSFMRNSPENYGLHPDSSNPNITTEGIAAEEHWTLNEAIRRPIFWVFVGARITAGTLGTALVFHQVSIFAQLGHSREVVAANFGTIALVNAVVTLGLGHYISRLRPGYVITTQLSLMALALWLSISATSPWMLLLYALTFGIVMALGSSFDGSVWADLFGREHHGTIRGFAVTTLIIGTSIGPILFGLSFDHFGSYEPVIWGAIAFTMIPAALSMFMKRPRKHLESAPGA